MTRNDVEIGFLAGVLFSIHRWYLQVCEANFEATRAAITVLTWQFFFDEFDTDTPSKEVL